ncbi:alkaline phosphatase family protein [Acidobacteriota bacterium]
MANSLGKIHFFLYTICFWSIVFGMLMAVLFIAAGLFERKKAGFVSEFLTTSVVLFIALAGYGIYLYYDYSTPPHYPPYLLRGEMLRVVLIVFGISVVGGIVGHFKLKLWRKIIKYSEDHQLRMRKVYRRSVISSAFLFMYFLISSVVSNSHLTQGKESEGTQIKSVYVLGLDGASWNILIPLLKSGALPNLKEMITDSSYGHFATYGEQFTPPVWASIATGMKTKKHMITRFYDTIYNLRTKPLWEILSEKGEKVGVVNWMNAYPAVELNGFMLTNNQGRLPYKFSVKYPEDFELLPEELFIPDKEESLTKSLKSLRGKMTSELDNARRVIDFCTNFHSYRAIFNYIHTIDSIQHFFWADFKSGEKEVFLRSWEEIDRFIGDINKRIGKKTLFCIMSDHGSRDIKKPEIVLNLEKILTVLNYLAPAGDGDEEETEAPLVTAVNEELISISKDMSNKEFSQLVTELRNIKFSPSNKRIFSKVNIFDRKERRLIGLKLTKPLKIRPKNPERIKIKGKEYVYNDIVYPHPWEGRHRARGMILMSGPGIKRKFLGAWLVDSPYSFLFRIMHGRIDSLDRIYPLLKYFHIADPVTTLDVTPTLLTFLRYPIAKDMDGKDFASVISAQRLGKALKPIKSYGLHRYYDKNKKMKINSAKKVTEEMRALGYIK